MEENSVALLGEMIPILAIVLGLGLVMVRIYLDFRKKREMFQLYHAERMAAIEKGIELPPLPEEFFRERRIEPSPVRNRRVGLILLFLGFSVTGAMWGTGNRDFWWGLVPVALGIAFLLAAFLEAREQAGAPGRVAPQPPARL